VRSYRLYCTFFTDIPGTLTMRPTANRVSIVENEFVVLAYDSLSLELLHDFPIHIHLKYLPFASPSLNILLYEMTFTLNLLFLTCACFVLDEVLRPGWGLLHLLSMGPGFGPCGFFAGATPLALTGSSPL